MTTVPLPHRLRPILVGLLLLACRDGTAPTIDPDPIVPGAALRVLFIGNSLTEGNDLPGMVAAIANAVGRPIDASASLRSGSNLQDHWELTDARETVEQGNFDIVVLQQGPSALPESRVDLVEWTSRWAPVIRAAGARPALYAVWPAENRSFDFARVSESYRIAAEEVGGIFLPAGDTWLRTWDQDPQAPLYSHDRFHPSIEGTYAAAVVIVSRLLDVDPISLPHQFSMANLGTVEIDRELAHVIQLGARAALAGSSGAIPNEAPVR